MKYRYFDLDKLEFSSAALLPVILGALPIPEDYEHIAKIEHLLRPMPEDPNEQKSIQEIQRDFEKKIDRLSEIYSARHRHGRELMNAQFRSLKEKQDRAFRNLRNHGRTDSGYVSDDSAGFFLQNLEHGLSRVSLSSVTPKPRNWFAKQIVNLLFDV